MVQKVAVSDNKVGQHLPNKYETQKNDSMSISTEQILTKFV